MTKTSVALIGASGYTGLECAKLLLQHPNVQLVATFTRHADWSLAQDLNTTAAAQVPNYHIDQLADHMHKINTVFLATPPELSMHLVAYLLAHNIQVIDLSGAFRLDQAEFEQYYKIPHSQAEYLDKAHYGLTPWCLQPKSCSRTGLIANPGCFATAALMTLLPLLNANIIDTDNIIIDAKSGLSGAGRQAKSNLMYCEAEQNFYPYKIGQHQHLPEIIKYCNKYAQSNIELQLTTQVLPIMRGIQLSTYVRSKQHVSDAALKHLIKTAYIQAYSEYPLFKLGSDAELQLLNLKYVINTAFTHIYYQVHNGKINIFTCIDNLMKGAASQAIENFNSINGWALNCGLTKQEVCI